jgi:hypothetical protein
MSLHSDLLKNLVSGINSLMPISLWILTIHHWMFKDNVLDVDLPYNISIPGQDFVKGADQVALRQRVETLPHTYYCQVITNLYLNRQCAFFMREESALQESLDF